MTTFTISPAVNGKTTWTIADGALNLNTSGEWTITPNATLTVTAKFWGAGGGRAATFANGGVGGGGGYATGNITLSSGQAYKLRVGGGGASNRTGGYNGGGTGGGGSGQAGGGGGATGIYITSAGVLANSYLIAGGGGGGGWNDFGTNGEGGAGGGSSGTAGGNGSAAGSGGGAGTQVGGGTGGTGNFQNGGAGTALTGGNGGDRGNSGATGGGGGGGYYGGGGGAGQQSINSGGGGGGGGSGYFNSSFVTSATLTAGSGTTPGNSADAVRGTAGDGAATVTTAGVDGRAYLTILPPASGIYFNKSSATFGESILVEIYTTGLSDGTSLSYAITGVTSAQINGASLTGTVTTTGNYATFTVQTVAGDYTTTTFAVSIASLSFTRSIPLTSNVRSFEVPFDSTGLNSKIGAKWNGSLVYSGTTDSLPDRFNLAYSITGITLNKIIEPVALTGNIQAVRNPGVSYSVQFDGTGDFLTIDDNPFFEIASDFCVEAWFYPTSAPNAFQAIISKAASGIFSPYSIYVTNAASNNVVFYSSSTGSSWDIASGTVFGTCVFNTWNHVAVTRQGSTISLWFNGALANTITNSNALFDNTRKITIGGRDDGTELFYGYISNVRIVRGYAIYTTGFTPPTARLQAVTGTVLLVCQSSTLLKDNSIYNWTVVRGTPSTGTNDAVVRFLNPNPTTFSAQFNTSQVTVTGNTVFDFGSGNFTLEFWVLWTTTAGTKVILDAWNTAPTRFLIRTTSGVLQWYTSYGGDGYTLPSDHLGRWNHIALVRNGTTTTLYYNGTQVGTPVTSSAAITTSTANWTISTTAEPLTGWLSNVRILKGVAAYTGNFTPPSLAALQVTGASSAAAYPSTTNVNTTFEATACSLLTCKQSRIRDDSSNNITLTLTAAPTISSSNYAESTYSVFFDSTQSASLTVADNVNLRPGSGAFTIEAWIWRAASGVAHSIYSKGGAASGVHLGITSTNLLQFTHTTSLITAASTIPAATWTHVAVVREGTGSNQVKLYVNGQLDGFGTSATDFTQTDVVRIGVNRAGGADFFNGYISNVRFAKSAIYTGGSFDGSSGPTITNSFTGITDESATAATITNVNNFVVFRTSIVPFTNAVSAYFIGNTSRVGGVNSQLTAPNISAYQFGTGDFTIEFFMYRDGGAAGTIMALNTASAGNWAIILSTGILYFQSAYATTTIGTGIPAATLTANTWHHVAIVRIASTITVYINGAVSHTMSDSTNYNGTGTLVMGYGSAGAAYGYYEGYLSNVRIVKGVGVYTGAFTRPSSPLTTASFARTNVVAVQPAQTSLLLFNTLNSAGTNTYAISSALTTTSQNATNVHLLTCQLNTWKDNSSNNFAITLVNSIYISEHIPELITSKVTAGSIRLVVFPNPAESSGANATYSLTVSSFTRTASFANESIAPSISLKSQTASIEYIDTEVTDVHVQGLEAKVTTFDNMYAVLESYNFRPSVTAIEYIDTEVTDIHNENLEAKVSTVTNQAAQLESNQLQTNLTGFVSAPTFAYSSGEDVKVSPPPVQTWYL